MPHQCTQCGHTFPDGSKEMLSGCPDCGGNKFQFQPAADSRERTISNSSSPPSQTPDSPSTVPEPTDDPVQEPADEDRAQADARRDVASPDELAAASDNHDTEPDSALDESDTSAERSNIESLRAELNDQFESIKILEPGQYELNLMELYNREEYIIALQEDGQYVIEVPDSWLGNDE